MTLVELLVTLAVMAIVMAGIAQSLVAFQTIHTVQSYKRQASSAGRQGLAMIERDLRGAGYGIEPGLAIDFNVYQGGGIFCGGTVTANACAQPDLATSRDRTTGPDQLVFYSRDPKYWGGDTASEPEGWAWQIATNAGTFRLKAHASTQQLLKGQILQVVCGGAVEQAYVTVLSTTSLSGSAVTSVPVTGTVAADPFQQAALVTGAGSCLSQSTARAFLVNRYRYYVNPVVLLPDGRTDSFLMLDTGLDRNGDGAVNSGDDIPVARAVVDLQIGYVRPVAGAAVGTTVEVGNLGAPPVPVCAITIPAAAPAIPLSKIVAAVACPNGLRILDFNTGASRYSQYSYLPADLADPLRRSEDLGNVAAVHVTVVARSEGVVRSLARTRAPATMNRTAASIVQDTANSPYVYSVQETMIPVRNVIAASMLSFM